MTNKPEEINKAFSRSIPQLQTAWDSTSLGILKTCPRKYYYSMIENWVPQGESIHLTFGIHFHKALELYDKALALGGNHEDGTHAAVTYIQTLGTRDDSGAWTPWDTDRMHKDYGIKNRYTLLRAVLWYLEKFNDDPARTLILENGKPAVELSFRLGIGTEAADGSEYFLCGHLDRVVEFGPDVWVTDRKTTKSALADYYFNQYTPNNQITLYSLAGRVISQRTVKGVIMDAAQLLVGGARFARKLVYRTQAQLDEWLRDAINYFRLAERYADAEYWPQNDTACDKFGGCHFREICGADPSVRDLYLKSKFDKRMWDPLDSRE